MVSTLVRLQWQFLNRQERDAKRTKTMKYIHISTWNGEDMSTHNYAKLIDIENPFDYLKSLEVDDYELELSSLKLEYYSEDEDGEVVDFGRHTLVPYDGQYAVDILCNINDFSFLSKEEYESIEPPLDEDDQKQSLLFWDDGEYFRTTIKLK